MKVDSAQNRRRKAPHRFALHYVRPLLLAGTGVLLYGVQAKSVPLIAAGIALEGLAALFAIVLHISYQRRREQENHVVCG